jgi:CheY-like chemotaxis protein
MKPGAQGSESNFVILLVEDEENDALLLQRALRKNKVTNPVHWMKDGVEALDYLSGQGPYSERSQYPFPQMIILDLKMPRMTGLELLAYLQQHPELRVIPTIVMSSSQIQEDIEKAYDLGANTYMVKPTEFDSLAGMIKSIYDYWAVSARPEPRPDSYVSTKLRADSTN